MKFLLLIYLIGFAKGASGQPDEPLGSINPQASIQPRPGEHFSLINPSDAEALYATVSSEQSSNDYSSEHSSSENSSSEQAPDDQPLDEEPFGENPSGENAAGEKIQREQLSSEKPLDEKVASGKISNEQSPGEKPSVEQVSSEKSSAEKVSSEQSSVEQPSGKKIVSGKSQSEQSSGDSSSSEQPSREPSSGTLSTASSSGAGINCHTCLFMNEQGRCLRGEGVCTTQNSQQCMLKKIFEGGRLQFMVQGCENMCPSMNLFSHGTRMQIICCRNRSLCNKV